MIKDDLDQLNSADYRRLITAHNIGVPQFVELPNGRFVGVHIKGVAHLKVVEQAGDWCNGEVKSSKGDCS